MEQYTLEAEINNQGGEESKYNDDVPRQIISPMFLDLSGNANDRSQKQKHDSILVIENSNFGDDEFKESMIGIHIQ